MDVDLWGLFFWSIVLTLVNIFINSNVLWLFSGFLWCFFLGSLTGEVKKEKARKTPVTTSVAILGWSGADTTYL